MNLNKSKVLGEVFGWGGGGEVAFSGLSPPEPCWVFFLPLSSINVPLNLRKPTPAESTSTPLAESAPRASRDAKLKSEIRRKKVNDELKTIQLLPDASEERLCNTDISSYG